MASRRAGSRVGQRRSGNLLTCGGTSRNRPSAHRARRTVADGAGRLETKGRGLVHAASRRWVPGFGWDRYGRRGRQRRRLCEQASPAGEGEATAYVGLRVEAIEQVTSELCGFADRGYQQRTAVSPIGYLMPENRWRAWLVNSATAEAVAEQLAAAVTDYGLLYCEKLAANPAEIVEAVRNSATGVGPPGECRQALALIGLGRFEEALAFVASCEEEVQGKEGQWAEQERRWVAAFKQWWARRTTLKVGSKPVSSGSAAAPATALRTGR